MPVRQRPNIILDEDQRRALRLAKARMNLFITGAAGSGKSVVLRAVVQALQQNGRHVALTASTGLAALGVGGRTIHSYLGTQIAGNVAEADVVYQEYKEEKRVGFESRLMRVQKRLKRLNVLVIDEVSMLTGDYLNMVDWWIRKLTRSEELFGGKQVIFCGDYFQLPPVVTREMHPVSTFGFQSSAWRDAGVQPIMLTQNHRQRGDATFKSYLDSLRSGRLNRRTAEFFGASVGRELDRPTKLFARNVDVDVINSVELSKISGPPKNLRARFEGYEDCFARLLKCSRVDQVITVKVDAHVLLARNVYEEGNEYFNGERGIVTAIHHNSVDVQVETDGRTVHVRRQQFEYKNGDGEVLAWMQQYPLKLAYALTIHKSQGMTLSRVECDLSRCFAPGQAYTALSRARELRGLSLHHPLTQRDVFSAPECVEFYRSLTAKLPRKRVIRKAVTA
jgi:ATP-dependent exoDNAse (exonuclease V) alpha subunit